MDSFTITQVGELERSSTVKYRPSSIEYPRHESSTGDTPNTRELGLSNFCGLPLDGVCSLRISAVCWRSVSHSGGYDPGLFESRAKTSRLKLEAEALAEY